MADETVTLAPEPSPDEAKQASLEAGLRAAGESTTVPVFTDYFAFEEKKTVTLPDGAQWVQIKALNEGERKKYRNASNRGLTIKKGSGDANMNLAPGDDLHNLLRLAIVDWHVLRAGPKGPVEVPFSKGSPGANLEQFLSAAPPAVIDVIDKEVRKMNPWLLGEMELEDMYRERDNLNEMIALKEREEEGKAS